MSVILQTQDELIRVMSDWMDNFAPADVLHTHNNGLRLSDFCLEKHGAITASGLNEAYAALKAQGVLNLKPAPPAPKVKTADELAAEEIAKQHRDYMKSITPQESFDDKVARDKQKRLAAEAVKAQQDAKGQLALAISGYQCYRVNGAGIDYAATEMVQRELRTIKGLDPVRLLVFVKQVIQELPDHPKSGDVARTLDSIKVRL